MTDAIVDKARSTFSVGTSGWSFTDWVGPFYPPGTRKQDMFESYVRAFNTVEVNYSYYRMPSRRTMDALVRKSPPNFDFWVKAHQDLTHKQQLKGAEAFLDALNPLQGADKLAGVLLQFPQSFHRTEANRQYLADLIDVMGQAPLAVEFRHCSWRDPAVEEGLARRNVCLVIPDVPDIRSLYHHEPTITGPAGYLRLHSRKAQNWYAGAVERYDYEYSRDELEQILSAWTPVLDEQVDKVYAFFNNCHRGQAANNAQAFQRLMGQIDD